MTNKLVSFLQLQQEKKQIWHKKVFLEHEGKKVLYERGGDKIKEKILVTTYKLY